MNNLGSRALLMIVSKYYGYFPFRRIMNEYCGDGSLDLAAGLSVLNLSGNGGCFFKCFVERRRDPLFVDEEHGVVFRQYEGESDLENIVPLITKVLSEPYSLYTYRYFIYNWPELCLLVRSSFRKTTAEVGHD